MKVLKFWAVLALVSLLAIGCGKKSGLEGKVVDGKGQPIANVKVVASQVQPIKGYEQFEATTGSDGSFRFGKLFPSSEYALFPWSDDWANMPMMTVQYDPTNLRVQFYKGGWITDRKMTAQSGPEGETMILPASLMVKSAVTTVEGKFVNGKGQPFANLKIVAKQVQPMKGYEQFETTTEADGTFRFDKLCPVSQYILTAQEGAFFSEKKTLRTGLDEQIEKNSSPLTIRFMVSSEGAIADSRTGLEWVVGPDRDTNYAQAEQWVANCKVMGGGWRMPTRQELRTIYQQGVGERNMDPAFKTTGYYVWAEPRDSSSACYFNFSNGSDIWDGRDGSNGGRGFGVRSRPR
jgi:hypothetical protein